MTTYAWPGFGVSAFEMRVAFNQRSFSGPYTPVEQVVDLLGERWVGTIGLSRLNARDAAAFEAFVDRLGGRANTWALYHLRLPAPQGTLRDGVTTTVRNGLGATVSVRNGLGATVTTRRGQPVLKAAVKQGDNTAIITTVPGYTLYAGDLIGIANQVVRQLVDATADSNGYMAIEFSPRARYAWPIGSLVAWDKPTFNARLKADGVPTQWKRAYAEGASFDFVEAL